jgi:hypothetical protein
MVSRRRYRSSPGPKLAGILFFSLAALALASSAYLNNPRVPVRMAHKAVLSGIAPIYRQISEQAAQAAPVPGITSPAVIDDSLVAAFLRLDGYAEEADATGPVEMDSPVSSAPARGVTVSMMGGRWLSPGGARRPAMPEDLSGAAALVFNGSFSSLFTRIFDPQADESGRNAELSAEARNPFSEAKQKEDAARHTAVDPAQTSRNKAATDAQPGEPASPAQEAITAGGPAAKPERYAFLGDFDGSGALSILTAERSGELAYMFADGSRTFSIFINPSAVESQRSLALDDVNGDGIMDLLVTARANLFGGVLIGDGKGDYAPAGTFLTGYEPVLPAVGPWVQGGREIITVNTRSGAVTRFIPSGTYLRRSIGKLDFLPDYINHLVEPEPEVDYLQMARTGGEPKLYEWPLDGRLERRALKLPAASDLQAGPDPALGSRIRSIRIYQVGAYASVVLANTAGQTFNVANLKVSPQACLVFGNLEGKGNLDVGVAHMVSFTPSE